MNNYQLISFLQSFFKLFNAKIELHNIYKDKVYGKALWINENETQEFVYNENIDSKNLLEIKYLCDFIFKNFLIDGDKIKVSEIELIFKLMDEGWDEIRAKNAINKLCSIEVKMLDNGEETDSFFIHF